ncbi:hypothetical protein LMG28727_06201 [Paraburkholderia kirstenboschensis]|uniref:hypothetical protein n=1 Tax=Paraburkholderia kirstenboschensis TaxID=1245436 RepID=UPI000B3185BF|nr:hypothetical protein [Paraburkholderia kirstenboschensis]CAD6556809.1 hypothetical protein LMG28727_06201 [Paraburkholderia kirstenboschensis]
MDMNARILPFPPISYGHPVANVFSVKSGRSRHVHSTLVLGYCAYTGCAEQELGPRAFAFVRLAYVTAGLSRREYKRAPLGAELERACANISMLLRDRPPGTTADITGDSVLYWDGVRLNGAHLSTDEPGRVVDPFEPEDLLPQLRENVAAWIMRPAFTFRPSLLEWLDDARAQEPSR